MTPKIYTEISKKFNEVEIDQFAVQWLQSQSSEFGEPGRIARQLLEIVADLLDIDANNI